MVKRLDLAVKAMDKVLDHVHRALLIGVKDKVPTALKLRVAQTEERLRVERQLLMGLYLEVRTHLDG